ncbi:hypothetical protein [Nocardia concava]|uniref:hypothetical protein n=1 Tax=Nocardia concava TaxID=257281 RepID=UPI000312E53E|nr:hypothetical protein [Nocardia concava]
MKLVHAAGVLAAAILTAAAVTGCSDMDGSPIAVPTTTHAAPQTTIKAPQPTHPAAAPVQPAHTPKPVSQPKAPAPANKPQATATPTRPADVSCGIVADAGGDGRHVIAYGTDAGVVGCTEALTVATDYANTISDSDAVDVDGWSCNAQPDAQTPSICAKNGLLIGLGAH